MPTTTDFEVWSWAQLVAHYEGKNAKGVRELVDATTFPEDAKSLPLTSAPMGQTVGRAVENQTNRLEAPVRFESIRRQEGQGAAEHIVRVTVDLKQLHPHMVPKSHIERESRYRFQTRCLIPRKQAYQEAWPAIYVDTTPFLRCTRFPEELTPDNVEDAKDEDLDIPFLSFYETGKPCDPEAVPPKDTRLRDLYDCGTEKKFTQADRVFSPDRKRFECIRIAGTYDNKEWAARFPAPYFDFEVVPIRTEYEYKNLFSMTAERTVIFSKLVLEFKANFMPQDLITWMNDWAKDIELRKKHQYAEFIEKEIQRRHEVCPLIDEDSSVQIPLDVEKVDEYLKEMGQPLFIQFAASQEYDDDEEEEDADSKKQESSEKESDEKEDEVEDDQEEEEEEEEEEDEEDEEEPEDEEDDGSDDKKTKEEGEEEEEETEDDDDEEYDREEVQYGEFCDAQLSLVAKNSEEMRSILEQRFVECYKFMQVCQSSKARSAAQTVSSKTLTAEIEQKLKNVKVNDTPATKDK